MYLPHIKSGYRLMDGKRANITYRTYSQIAYLLANKTQHMNELQNNVNVTREFLLPDWLQTGTLVFPCLQTETKTPVLPTQVSSLPAFRLELPHQLGSREYPSCGLILWILGLVNHKPAPHNKSLLYMCIYTHTHTSYWFCFCEEPN